ncbi:aminopeptidase P family protein [Alteromonas pelagimontana]|uniref:Aminopeptidase P family protein n=1 Tax=Alteromonas pelagimontana TaxID=1858656 RepID=A0A6M4MDF7_9ALTE|nr:Xaa-Pro peptidase family protein [Alteromonas pelagimontana]QJR80176.1 aminopeptidase P family protein [Alteromonas pelagimontana]
MTGNGIGGKTAQQALATLSDMTTEATPIALDELQQRVAKAQTYMREHQINAIYLNAGTNLEYFTGMQWYASERLVGAILPAEGDIIYIAPTFEIDSLKERQIISGNIEGWQEHENPYALFCQLLKQNGAVAGDKIGIDESTAFFIVDGINKQQAGFDIINASEVTAHCRMHKSANEIALIQRAMDMTLAVHKATASILREGITTTEVEQFIHQAHKQVGAPGGNYFCIVLFGIATSFPHGVKDPQVLQKNDLVLIDTGCKLHGYLSDITRTYVFGEPTEKQRFMWESEKQAQFEAFDAANIGVTCGDVDNAARTYLQTRGLGPDYMLPGLPHRTGHGIGMDIHEWPYLVKDNPVPLATGMCFSNEPMIVVPGEFGIRLEDHFYMTESGAKWFTQPANSITDPFGS